MKTRVTASLLYLAFLACAIPAQANSYLVFHKDKAKKTEERSQMVWHSSQPPIPGKNIPADCTVIEIPKEMKGKPIQELKRDGFTKLVHEPVKVVLPTPSAEKLIEREIEKTLRDTASDTTITDVEYARLLRISKIEDPVARKAEWDKIKVKVKKK